MAKSLEITIILSVLIPGLGHMYQGILKRGIAILIVGIALIITWIFVPRFVPYPYGWVIVGLYWIWQIVDARRLHRKMKSEVGASDV